MMSSSQMQCLTLNLCHYSWLNILMLRSIQMVQSEILQRGCQFFILFYFAEILKKPFPKQSLYPMKAILVASSNPIHLMHDEHGLSPSPLSLNAIPNFMFDSFACVWDAKNTLFGYGGRCMRTLHSLIATALCQTDHIKAVFLSY